MFIAVQVTTSPCETIPTQYEALDHPDPCTQSLYTTSADTGNFYIPYDSQYYYGSFD